MKRTNNYITAYFEDDDDLKVGIKSLLEKKVTIHDVLTPFAVHGLDHLLNFKRSRIPKVGFISGMVGGVSTLLFQTWVFTKAWPLNIGGKPFFALPSFIPVTFELSVLIAAFGMIAAYFISSNIGPGSKNVIYDERVTDDRFLIIIDLEKDNSINDKEKIKEILKEIGAKGITIKE
ncbi:MAG: DUF3341 domain-containing protein [Chlorobi bacterium]|nr:DUF3341 domain-containing protein [Chlorobiota bacterium]